MKTNPSCPVCNSNNWEIIGKIIYKKNETSHLTEYARVRYEVLFDVWLTGKVVAEFHSILCNRCGFVTFTPRPTSIDLDRKYHYLAKHPSSKEELSSVLLSDKKRSDELFFCLKRYLHDTPVKILDYGGGNGRLMKTFVDTGHECAVIDYIEDTLPNIQRLGSNVNDIPNIHVFDIIICSHVLEHLSDPADVVKNLIGHLKELGILYIEVPFEIWDGAPLPVEPVTHINFFTTNSIRYLLSLCGLKVLDCEEGMYTTEQGGRAFAIRAYAQKTTNLPENALVYDGNGADTKKYISPSFFMKWKRFFKYPEHRRKVLKNWTNKHLPKTFFWRFFN